MFQGDLGDKRKSKGNTDCALGGAGTGADDGSGALQVRAETVRREVTYEAVEGEAELPDEITVSVLAGNDEELVRCRAVDQVEEDAYWRDDFSFPITFL